ncbi:MAG TPA: phosphomannomutase/phosphoglucomutase, partial [Alcaligenes faecalis]|nr:phosphomannomutase/phosphoglucomutase [Alcaligenes faecalis]
MTHIPALPTAVFKAYDIRGTVPEQLNPDFAYQLGLALAALAREQSVQTLVVGYDGRHSSPALSRALQQGIQAGGINTVDLGMVPTPVVYFAANVLETGSGVAITGSHNPSNYNGFKMMMAGKTLHGQDIQGLMKRMQAGIEPAAQAGTGEKKDLLDQYVSTIAERVKLARPMKIALDCGNGVGGVVAARLFKALGCEVDMLFEDVDGSFPN